MAGLNPFLKNFFFKAFKSRKDYKNAEKEMGTIDTVSIIITPEKAFMRSQSQSQKIDVPIEPDELKTFLKRINVKEQTIKESKSIFVVLEMEKQNIIIRQKKIDDTTKIFELW